MMVSGVNAKSQANVLEIVDTLDPWGPGSAIRGGGHQHSHEDCNERERYEELDQGECVRNVSLRAGFTHGRVYVVPIQPHANDHAYPAPRCAQQRTGRVVCLSRAERAHSTLDLAGPR